MTDFLQDELAARKAGMSYGQYVAMKAEQAAREAGISYGQYVAMEAEKRNHRRKAPDPLRKTRTPQPKHYDDRKAFRLWQTGMSDRQIGAVFGVSRTVIQRWRDRLEIPSLVAFPWISTAGFQIVRQDGSWFVLPPSRVYRVQRCGWDAWAVGYEVQPGFFKKRV